VIVSQWHLDEFRFLNLVAHEVPEVSPRPQYKPLAPLAFGDHSLPPNDYDWLTGQLSCLVKTQSALCKAFKHKQQDRSHAPKM
jgi:hypothetical protein